MEVVDSGRGFTEEEARRFFVPFYTTKKNGHGLGLSISRAIIKDHQGTIEARGEPGAGAVFTIRLPVRLEAPVNAEAGNA
jgi:signal transduction histidine kinase